MLRVIADEFSQMRLTEDDGSHRVLSLTELNGIRNSAKELEAVLKAELSNWDTYFVSQKGAYNTADLINNAVNLLPESARLFLSPEALEDIRQSGRCLTFNMGTAAAFHIVRATEGYIWRYYAHVIGHLPVKVRNWGAYIKNLEKCGKADTKVLGWMRQIKDEYRNPVLHPNERVSPEDAQEFINACISLMTAIARVLIKSQAEAPPSSTNP